MQQVKKIFGVASLGACLFVSLPSFAATCSQQVEHNGGQPRSPIETDEQNIPAGMDDTDASVDFSSGSGPSQRSSNGSRGFDDYSGSNSGSSGNSDLF